jgi:thioredoxin-related protein
MNRKRMTLTEVAEASFGILFAVAIGYICGCLTAFALENVATADEPKPAFVFDDYATAYRKAELEKRIIVVVISGNECPACVRLVTAWIPQVDEEGLLEDCYVCKLNRDASPMKCEEDTTNERDLVRRFLEITKSRSVPQVIAFDMASNPVRTTFLTSIPSIERLRDLLRQSRLKDKTQ